MNRFTRALKITTMAVTAATLMATSAMATDGMFGNGTGARNKALAGAGVADQNDATAMSINPAGLTHSPDQLAMLQLHCFHQLVMRHGEQPLLRMDLVTVRFR